MNSTDLYEQHSAELPFITDRVWSSPSDRFAMVRSVDQRQIAVWDFEHARVSCALEATNPHHQRCIATFVTWNGEEIVLCGRNGSELEAYAAETGQCRWTVDCETFRFERLVPFDAPGAIVAVGFFDGETKNSLAVVDLQDAASRPRAIFEQFRAKTGVTDYAYRLDAGPAGARSFAAFRDPQDDEDDTSDDGDLHGLLGLYIRDVDGTLVEQLQWSPPEPFLGLLAAGARSIAVKGERAIHLVDRAAPSAVHEEPGEWLAADRDGSHLLVAQGAEWRILRL